MKTTITFFFFFQSDALASGLTLVYGILSTKNTKAGEWGAGYHRHLLLSGEWSSSEPLALAFKPYLSETSKRHNASDHMPHGLFIGPTESSEGSACDYIGYAICWGLNLQSERLVYKMAAIAIMDKRGSHAKHRRQLTRKPIDVLGGESPSSHIHFLSL